MMPPTRPPTLKPLVFLSFFIVLAAVNTVASDAGFHVCYYHVDSAVNLDDDSQVFPEDGFVGCHNFESSCPGHWDFRKQTIVTQNPDGTTTETEETVYGTWIYPMPDGLRTFHLSARFTGNLHVPAEAQYQFSIFATDGARLRIDGVPIFDESVTFTKTAGRNHHNFVSDPVALAAGTHSIDFDYVNGNAANRLYLSFRVWQEGMPAAHSNHWGKAPSNDFVCIDGSTYLSVTPRQPEVEGVCWGGKRFYTLDATLPTQAAEGCQSEPIALPSGAEVAPDDDITRSVLQEVTFGTACLATATSDLKSAAEFERTAEVNPSNDPNDPEDDYLATPAETEKPLDELPWSVEYVGRAREVVDGVAFDTFTYHVTVGPGGPPLETVSITTSPTCRLVDGTPATGDTTSVDPVSGVFGVHWHYEQTAEGVYVYTARFENAGRGLTSAQYSVAGGGLYAIGWVPVPRCMTPDGYLLPQAVRTRQLNSAPKCSDASPIATDAEGRLSVSCADKNRRILLRDDCRPYDAELSSHRGQPTAGNSLVVSGYEYATLHNQKWWRGISSYCGSGMRAMPDGWEISPYDDHARLVLMHHVHFGSGCLVFADGVSRAGVVSGQVPGDVCHYNALRRGHFTDLAGQIVPVYGVFKDKCPGQVLLRRRTSRAESDATHKAEREITRFKTSLGYKYAFPHNPWMSNTNLPWHGCYPRLVRIPRGWEIAPSTAATRAIIQRYPAGLGCHVFSDGTAVNREGLPCDGSSDRHWIAHQDITNVDGTVTKWATVLGCPGAVLIRQKNEVTPDQYDENCSVCQSTGDPHILNFDMKRFNSYGPDMIVLASAPNDQIDTCAERNLPAWECKWRVYADQKKANAVAINRRVLVQWMNAANVNEDITVWVEWGAAFGFHFKVGDEEPILENGVPFTTTAGAVVTKTEGSTSRWISRADRMNWKIDLPNKVTVTVFATMRIIDYYIHVPKKFHGAQRLIGLCGNCDSDPSNDFYDFTAGRMVDEFSDAVVIQNEFVNKMAVTLDPFDPTNTNPIPPPPPVTAEDLDPEAHVDPAKKDMLNSMAESCCRQYVGSLKYNDCRDEVFTFESCETVEDSMAQADKMELEVVTGNAEDVPTCPVASNLHTVTMPMEYGGRTYAVLDGNANDGVVGFGTQVGAKSIPEGWSLAEPDAVNLAFISCHPFQTPCMVFSDGSGVTTNGDAASCGANVLVKEGSNFECLSTKVISRILLVKDPDATFYPPLGSSLDGENGWFTQADGSGSVAPTPLEYSDRGRGKVTLHATGPDASLHVFKTVEFPAGQVTAASPPVSIKTWARVDMRCGDDDSYCLRGPDPRIQTNGAVYGLYVDVIMRHTSDTSGIECLPEVSNGANCRHASVLGSAYSWYINGDGVGSNAGWEESDLGLVWSRVVADEFFVEKVVLHLVIRGGITGAIQFDVPAWSVIGERHFNYINNGDFDGSFGLHDDAYVDWVMTDPASPPATVSPRVTRSGLGHDYTGNSGSLLLDGSIAGRSVSQMISLSPDRTAKDVLLCTYAKTEAVPGAIGEDSALWVDVLCDNDDDSSDCHSYKNIVATQVGTSPWHRVCKTISVKPEATRLAVSARLRLAGGPQGGVKSYFDGVAAVPTCSNPLSLYAQSGVYGDPHYLTCDGLRLDVMGVGEYLAYQDNFVTMQVRHEAAGSASILTSLVLKHSATGSVIQVDRPATNKLHPTLRVNGRVIGVSEGVPYTFGRIDNDQSDEPSIMIEVTGRLRDKAATGSTSTGSAIRVVIRVLSTHQPAFDPFTGEATGPSETVANSVTLVIENTIHGTSYMNMFITRPQAAENNVVGMLGNCDGDPGNDLLSPRDQTVMGVPSGTFSAESLDLVQRFAEAWRVKGAMSSMFTYPTGSSFVDYYDPNHNLFDPTSVTQAEIDAARATCVVSMGTTVEEALAACIVDVLAGGEEYATSSQVSADISGSDAPLFEIEPPVEDGSVDVDDSGAAGTHWVWITLAAILPASLGTVAIVCACAVFVGVCAARWRRVAKAGREKDIKFSKRSQPDPLAMAEEGAGTFSELVQNAGRQLSNLVSGEVDPVELLVRAGRQISNFATGQQEYARVEDDRSLEGVSSESEDDGHGADRPSPSRHATHIGVSAENTEYLQRPQLRHRPASR